MSRRAANILTAHHIFLTRTLMVVLGCIAVWWGVIEFSLFKRESSIEHIARRIIDGDLYRVDKLALLLPVAEDIERSVYCRPAALQSSAIIKLRMAETAISENDAKDKNLESLGRIVRNSLSCNPADPFLWVILWWIESTQNGFRPDYLEYLRMSYLLGPNEGWIAQKRNRVTFAASEKLPVELSEYAAREFVGLVNMGLYEQMAETFLGPGQREQQQLLAHLQNIDEYHRRTFAYYLFAKGYDGALPSVERPVFRYSR